MRSLIFIFKLIISITATSLLVGCSYMNEVSNKNPTIETPVGLKPATPKTSCQDWCHNGWCSTHCENISTSN